MKDCRTVRATTVEGAAVASAMSSASSGTARYENVNELCKLRDCLRREALSIRGRGCSDECEMRYRKESWRAFDARLCQQTTPSFNLLSRRQMMPAIMAGRGMAQRLRRSCVPCRSTVARWTVLMETVDRPDRRRVGIFDKRLRHT